MVASALALSYIDVDLNVLTLGLRMFLRLLISRDNNDNIKEQINEKIDNDNRVVGQLS